MVAIHSPLFRTKVNKVACVANGTQKFPASKGVRICNTRRDSCCAPAQGEREGSPSFREELQKVCHEVEEHASSQSLPASASASINEASVAKTLQVARVLSPKGHEVPKCHPGTFSLLRLPCHLCLVSSPGGVQLY